jgi:hypothetical protein
MDMFRPQIESLSRRTRRRLELNRIERAEFQAKHPLLGRHTDPSAVNDILVGTSQTVPDTSRGMSSNLWGNMPNWNSVTNKVYDDFNRVGNANMTSAYAGSLGAWSIYGYAGATVSDAGLEGGVLGLTSDGDNEGVCILSSTGSFRFVTTSTLALNKRMAFEARVAKSTVVTAKGDMFVGLMAPTLSSGLPAAAQPITTTDDTLMTAGDFFGFHFTATTGTRGGPTEVGVAFELASGTINYPTNCTTLMASTGNTVLAANTYVKVGWVFDPNGPMKRVTAATARQTAGQVIKALVRFFVNGIELPTFLGSADVANATAAQAFPTSFMSPVFATMNAAAAGQIAYIDWIACAQDATA